MSNAQWTSVAASTAASLGRQLGRWARGAATTVAVVTMVAVLCAAPEISHGALPTAAPPKPAAKPAAAAHHVTSTHVRPQNRHLHRRTKDKPRATHHRGRTVRSHVIGYRTVVRHATGTVTGHVHASNSYPLPGASVHLTKPNGHKLHSRHARHPTTADASGEFTMHGVRPGRYRVVASHHGHGKGHAKTRVHGNATSTVSIGLK